MLEKIAVLILAVSNLIQCVSLMLLKNRVSKLEKEKDA